MRLCRPAGKLLERGKHLADKPARCFFVRQRGIYVKNLLPETELQGLAGNGEQTAPQKRRPAPGGGAESV